MAKVKNKNKLKKEDAQVQVEDVVEVNPPVDVDQTDETPPTDEEISPGGEDESVEEKLSPLEESEAKAQEYLDGWQRSRAEFSNYKKRVAREREQIHQISKGKVIKDYLDILDDLERALINRPKSGDGAEWAEGIELIYQKLQSKLEMAGVEIMDAEGAKFDPNLHEAIMQEETNEHESDSVIEVIQNGYLLGDRVLRPAMVRVAA